MRHSTVTAVVAALVFGTVSATTQALAAPAHATTSHPSRPSAGRATAAFDPTQSLRPSSGQPLHPYAGRESRTAAATSLGFATDSAAETVQGAAHIAAMPGRVGGYVRLHSLGAVARVAADGHSVWQRDTTSLYRDWKVSWQSPGNVFTPEVPAGSDAADPFRMSIAASGVVPDTAPLAVGDLNHDGTPDVSVAETVGFNLGGLDCPGCSWAFSVPGSDLHLGTFVTVLDGRTGTTLFSRLDPGLVSQLAVIDGQLLVGDETGDPAAAGSLGQWGSATTVTALAFAGHSRLTARTAWTYQTRAPWARLLGLQQTGSDSVAVTWTDTPLGLGQPGPPDGHAVLIDRSGKVRWDRRTAGYPVLSGYDTSRRQLAVVEQTDPVFGVGYSLVGLRIGDGSTAGSSAVSGVLPTAMAVGTSWVVGGIVTTPDHVSPPGYDYTAGQVESFDPSRGPLWTRTLAGSDPNEPQPGSVRITGGTVVTDSWTGILNPTPTRPLDVGVDLQAFSLATGKPQWERTGDVADPLSLDTVGTSVRGITQNEDAVSYDARSGRPGARHPIMGSLHAAAPVTVDGRSEVVAGGDSGAVYAWRTGALSQKPLWAADLGGPVRQLATVAGTSTIVAAATTGLAVIDARTGRVRHEMSGRYVWNAAAARIGARTVAVTGTDVLSGYDATSGRRLWTYDPGAGSAFSNAVLVDGVAVAEYQSATGPGAVGIDALTGHPLWTIRSDASSAQLINGVFGGPGIPGVTGDAVAVIWNDRDGDGTVDIRNPKTGALDFSNTDGNLSDHQSYALIPSVGLLSLSESSSVLLGPAGPVEVGVAGDGVTVARLDGTPYVLTARTSVDAFPAATLSNATSVADDQTFLPDQLVTVPGSSGTDAVLTLPSDSVNIEVIANELGQYRLPYLMAIQRGIAQLQLTRTPTTRAIALPRPESTTTAPATVAVQSDHPGAAQPLARLKVLGKSRLTSTTPVAYDPATVRKSLGLHGDGTGQTVAIVDAFDDANIAADVAHFSKQFGLPGICAGNGGDCFDLTVDKPQGSGGSDSGWALETSMDVEWIHAMAPHAHIVLEEAHDAYFSSLFAAVHAAAALHPDAISMSWGIGEEFSDEGYYDHFCTLSDSLCVVSSGDNGYPGSYPAYNPHALAVGGTTLQLAADGSVTDEQAWSGSGGGRSHVEARPAYQRGAETGDGRGIPDVSFDADPETGVAIYDTVPYRGQTGWFQVGGTSLGAPVWSALLAVTDQQRAAAGKARLSDGSAQRAIYGAHSGIADIAGGPSNGACPDICQPGPGYDHVTGLGSPRPGIDTALAAAP